jgi:hypothetical protein
MFCPSCGSEERQATQFCRACGTDLRGVRIGLERPDSITASAVTAREEIGRAVAEKIRQMEDARYLRRFAKYVLPKVEKFLESPEEKRLRRLRSGTITALIGLVLSASSAVLLNNVSKDEAEIFLGWVLVLSLIMLATGLGLLINGLLFSKPRKGLQDNSEAARVQDLLDERSSLPPARSPVFVPAPRSQTTANLDQPRGSVTDHTTLHLKSDRQ